jgi:Phage tail assembly chaperone proteins, E, or 41 or 14
MNIPPKREGFIDDKPVEKPSVVTHTIEAEPQQPQHQPRTMPPPEIEPSPAEIPERFQDEWPLVVPLLNKPIRNTKGELVKELKLREPRAGDINRYGNPVRINQDGDVVWDERKMTYMIAALSDILVPFIEDMSPRDWNTVAMKLRNFFLPDPRAW